MKLRQLLVLLFVGALCVPSPAFGGTIVFSDDFESSTYGVLPDSPAVGTWTEFDSTPGVAPNHAIAGNFGAQGMSGTNYFGAVIREAGIWNYMTANFTTELTDPTDVVRIDMDVYDNAGTPHISLYDSTGYYLAYVMLLDGTVYVPGDPATTTQTVDPGEWNHLAIEYSPGADNFDLYIDGDMVNVPVHGNGTGVGGNVSQIRFANVVGDDWACIDNVLVTVTSVPEPSTLALLGCGLTGLLVRGRRRR